MNTGNEKELYIMSRFKEEQDELRQFFTYVINRSEQIHLNQEKNFSEASKLRAENDKLKKRIAELESNQPTEGQVLFNPAVHMLKKKLPFTKDVWTKIGESWDATCKLPKKDRPSEGKFVDVMNKKHSIDNFSSGYLRIIKEEGYKDNLERCM